MNSTGAFYQRREIKLVLETVYSVIIVQTQTVMQHLYSSIMAALRYRLTTSCNGLGPKVLRASGKERKAKVKEMEGKRKWNVLNSM